MISLTAIIFSAILITIFILLCKTNQLEKRRRYKQAIRLHGISQVLILTDIAVALILMIQLIKLTT